MADDEKNEERSRKAKDEFDDKKKTLSNMVRLSDTDELGYDDIIKDMANCFCQESSSTEMRSQ